MEGGRKLISPICPFRTGCDSGEQCFKLRRAVPITHGMASQRTRQTNHHALLGLPAEEILSNIDWQPRCTED